MRGSARPLAVIGALTAIAACTDTYVRTNPYDPGTPAVFDILGPDSVFSIGELARYAVKSMPAVSDTAAEWSSPTVDFRVTSGGEFQLWTPPLWPATETVRISAGIGKFDTTIAVSYPSGPAAKQTTMYRRVVSKSVVLTQRLTRIALRCPGEHACDTLPAGSVWSVWVDGFDALGAPIVGFTNPAVNATGGPPIATFVVRDTTVAGVSPIGVRASSVTARKSGATWVVATRDVLLDSLRLVVR